MVLMIDWYVKLSLKYVRIHMNITEVKFIWVDVSILIVQNGGSLPMW